MQKLQQQINKLALYIDLIDQELNEISDSRIKHNAKQWLNKSKITVSRFIKECDRVLKEENQENFGITADNLRKIIDKSLGISE